MLGSLCSAESDGKDDLTNSAEKLAKLASRFLRDVNKQDFSETEKVFHAADDKEWKHIISQLKFVRRALGPVEIVAVSAKQLEKMDQLDHYALKWGKWPTLAKDQFLMTKRFGVRFEDGSIGMGTASIVVNRNFSAIPRSKVRLVQFGLAAPMKNRKFRQFYEGFTREFQTKTR
jgi:hypothetical protein